MFEVVTYTYGFVLYVAGRTIKIEKETFKTFTDPGTFLSGAIAGGVGRAAAIPFDQGGKKGIQQTIGRRMPQFGLLMMFYCPIAHKLLPGLEHDPRSKMLTTFMIGAAAGFNMRLLCNPISRVLDESLRTGKQPLDVARILKNKTILQFWYTTPNLLGNAFYFGTLFTVFEGLRRFNERNLVPIRRYEGEDEVLLMGDDGQVQVVSKPHTAPAVVDHNWSWRNYAMTVTSNFAVGGAAATVASTVCYPFSAHQYMQTVIHDSAICRGLVPTLMKEVPMVAMMFATFSAIQPLLAPRHGVRCGFGY
ncbi:putative mitochondrial hypothetical protein [Leptomonas pyrrhocoris]|uniref:Mitochondrial carrier protein n=1 Tax=Leptomonas pyrrhocoris TaxID=157538 RepID=A0A0M9G642_LEPPY|nr:putative mitochondrial hypothetical protein [Leptomonas pyrrhocoris]XP_015661719.1 putative mitochondrial hypothetical protein [Leptomonas pyrrhocoris]KPA83279.1 putative mitochondrial hypothetical protein [Leptomonas pyrrhocoris]KPA83280.1 putative mitochondrial hypothetical protein [Leptomonas pyrrhocoris]|eukprot:XP_015661718.1 putative mitochondrial hypothetical protein [Leptomonas pyrrhocoris]